MIQIELLCALIADFSIISADSLALPVSRAHFDVRRWQFRLPLGRGGVDEIKNACVEDKSSLIEFRRICKNIGNMATSKSWLQHGMRNTKMR